MPDLITVSHLTKHFGEKNVLSDLSFSIKKGSVTAIMAASGAGKTTLLRILLGLETPDSGSLTLNETPRISAVFQEDRLCENLSPLSNIRLVTGNTVPKSEILAALSSLGLSDSVGQPVRELSGGQKRRIALLRALLAPWDLLLLDEPFKGLDPESKKTAMDYVLKSANQKERTVLLVTHDPFEADYMADTVIRL